MPNEKRSQPALTAAERRILYAARRYVGLDLEKRFELRIKLGVYFQDPLVAAEKPAYGFDDEFYVPWERPSPSRVPPSKSQPVAANRRKRRAAVPAP